MHIWPYQFAMANGLDDVQPVIEAYNRLMDCPPFRSCKSDKWKRRRNKEFYRIMDVLKRLGGDEE